MDDEPPNDNDRDGHFSFRFLIKLSGRWKLRGKKSAGTFRKAWEKLMHFFRHLISSQTLLTVAVAMTLVLGPRYGNEPSVGQTFVTGIGERRSTTLSSGVVVDVDAMSKVQIFQSQPPQRDVIYVDSGQVFISSPDATASQPRAMIGGSVSAIVSGKVNIYRHANDLTEVTQISGTSQLKPLPGSGYAALCQKLRRDKPCDGVTLHENQRITTVASPSRFAQAQTLLSNEAAREARWVRGSLEFPNIPLQEAAAELQRYYHVRFEIDASLKLRPVGGTIITPQDHDAHPLDLIDGFAKGLTLEYHDVRVTIRTQDGQRIVTVKKGPIERHDKDLAR